MFHVLHRFWRWLLARLGYCGGAHFLAGAPSLPPPLTPEQEKVLLSRMAAGDAAARDDLITHNLRLVARYTTSRRLWVISSSRAAASPAAMRSSRAFSCSGVRGGGRLGPPAR